MNNLYFIVSEKSWHCKFQGIPNLVAEVKKQTDKGKLWRIKVACVYPLIQMLLSLALVQLL